MASNAAFVSLKNMPRGACPQTALSRLCNFSAHTYAGLHFFSSSCKVGNTGLSANITFYPYPLLFCFNIVQETTCVLYPHQIAPFPCSSCTINYGTKAIPMIMVMYHYDHDDQMTRRFNEKFVYIFNSLFLPTLIHQRYLWHV